MNFTCFRMEEVALVEDITSVDPDAHVTFSDITKLNGPTYGAIANGH